MYKQTLAVCLLAFVAVAYSQVVGWRDCGSTATIQEVRAGPCTTMPCPFVRGNTYNIQFLGTSTGIATQLPFNVTATILGLPWVIMEGNACTQITCPTAVGTPINFNYAYTVSEIFPPVPTTARTLVSNHLGAPVVCFEIDIQIQ